MTTRVQSQRFSATNTRPGTATRPSGEFWLNFPDLRLGMIDPSQTAVDLLAVRNYAASATYALGDYAVYSGQLQRAKVSIAPHAYNATEWDPLVTKSYTDGAFTTQAQNDARYVQLSGSTMTGFLTLFADPVNPLNASTKRYTDAQDALKLNLSGGTLTGPLILSGPPTSANMAATKGYVDTTVGNYLPLSGGVLSGTLRVSNGRLVSSGTNNPAVSVWDTSQNYAAGMFLGGSQNLYFGNMDGGGNYAGTWFGYFDSGRNFHVANNVWVGNDIHAPHFYADTNLGVNYSAIGSHWFAFGWNGNLQAYVDGGYQFDLASVTWVNNNFATYNWANGAFYSTGTSDGRYLYKTGDTCTGGLTVNGSIDCLQTIHSHADIHADTAIVGQYLVTSGTGGDYWQFWHQDNGPVYIRMDGAYDYGPINYVSDPSLKHDIKPADIDCLEIVNRLALKQFRWNGMNDLVPVGFVTDQLNAVFPAAVNHKPDDAPPGAEFYESVNLPVMVALLAGAVQQLAKECHA